MGGCATSTLTLPEEQESQLEAVYDEIEPLRERGRWQTARQNLDSILGNVPETSEYEGFRAALRALRADLCLDLDEPAAALEEARAAIEHGWNGAEVYDAAGWASYGLDRPESAREHFDEALERDPDQVSSLMGRALALIEIDDLDHARSDLTHALNIESNDPELYALRGEVSVRMAQFEQAERDLSQARQLAPAESDYALQLARLLMVQGRAEEASEVIDAAVDDEATALEALLLRSHIHLLGGRAEEARADAIRASNNFPDEAFAFVQLAHVQLAGGQSNLALKAAERAVELDPSLSDAYLVRGAARHMRGESEAASEDFERADRAPAELPMFLLGPCYEILEATGFQTSMRDMLSRYAEAADGPDGEHEAGKGPNPPFGQVDPMELLGQVFDDSGNMKKRFKPFLEMAMKNAPNILKNVPPSLLKNVGGLDPEALEEIDLSEMSSDQLEEQMRQFYEMMQSGENPFEGLDEDAPGGENDGEGDDDTPPEET
ncbi:MAG: tetratricopeptide repeat protein [Persicimonas sp.]